MGRVSSSRIKARAPSRLVDPKAGKVVVEVATGDKPAGVAMSKDGTRAVVTHWYGYDVALLDVQSDGLKVAGRVYVGPEPRGVVVSGDGATAYVATGASNEVVRVDLGSKAVTGRLAVGREPRGLALTPDGKRLVVANSRSGDLSVVDVGAWKVERTLPLEPGAANLRQIAVDPAGKYAYLVHMRNRGMATTQNNIDLGWVLGQRLSRVAARRHVAVRDGDARREGPGLRRRPRPGGSDPTARRSPSPRAARTS